MRLEYRDLTPQNISGEIIESILMNDSNDSLSAERQLSDDIGVSRTTVRSSLESLKRENFLESKNRSGIIKYQKSAINMLDANSMSEELESNDIDVDSEVIDSHVTHGIPEFDSFIGQHDAEVFVLERRRIINGTPVTYEKSYLLNSQFPNIDKVDFSSKQSLYSVLKESYQVNPTQGQESIEYSRPTALVADYLMVDQSEPLFKVESKSYDSENSPIEYSVQYLVAKNIKYKMVVENILEK